MGSVWFAIATVSNLAVGRVTFAVGISVALGAVFALQKRRTVIAGVLASVASLATPLAGLFLAVSVIGLGLARRRWRIPCLIVAAAAGTPIVAVTLAFGAPGSFPYEPWALIRDLLICTLVFLLIRKDADVVRWGVVAYIAVLVGAFVVPSPLGGNVSRLAQLFAGPVLAAAGAPRRKLVLALLAAPLLFWQWFPATDAIAFANSDPSTRRAYYEPLLAYLDAQHNLGRVEIPSTLRHWETAYVAPQVSLARGWERQLDIGYNPVFYDGTLTTASYQTWLEQNAVEYVALPNVPLDDSSVVERQILVSGPPYLTPVWSNANWRVWRVDGYHGLVDGSAEVVRVTASTVILFVDQPGDITIHIHYSPHWAVGGGACLSPSADGWIHVHGATPGRLTLSQRFIGTPCRSS
jgi:hypothetical protein